MQRREFLERAVQTTALTALSAGRVLGANERIGVAVIGCGGRGIQVASGMRKGPDTEIRAVCDVYEANAEKAAEKLSERRAAMHKDFRRVLEMKDVDAVLVATPDHWHAIPTVLACQAGKHVLVEKPFSLTIREGRAMVEAARKHNRVVMPATQHRSSPHIAEAARIVQGGEIGEVSFVRSWNSGNVSPNLVAPLPDSDPPPGLDWDFYLGPSPNAPFNRRRFLGSYRQFYDYAGGYITDFGNHRIDSVQQIMNVTAPQTVSAVGRRVLKQNVGDIFDLHIVTYEFPRFVFEYTANWSNGLGLGGRSGLNYYGMRGDHNRPHGFAFYGTKGTLFVDRIGHEIYPEVEPGRMYDDSGQIQVRYRMERKTFQGADATELHAQNFIRHLRGEKAPADAETGHRSTSTCLLGTIAAKVGRKLKWDAEREDFVSDAEASRLLSRQARKPWDLI